MAFPKRFVFAITAFLTILLASFLGGVVQPSADAATVPYHTPGIGYCGQSRMDVYPPSDVRSFGGTEQVFWSPDLYKWIGSNWQLVDNSKPWLWATATSSGLLKTSYGTWFNMPSSGLNIGQPQRFFPFTGLGAGDYKLVNHYFWGSNGTHIAEWSPGYCHVS